MENAEEVFHFLEEFSKRKPKSIPQELNDYLAYVARTGDPVYQWSLVKCLFKEKLLNVITDFYETTPGIDIPPYPNVDPFNYDIMKNSLLERLDSFTSAPFTVQRICELLTYPRKQYNRVDKFMRAIEKNILVVSTREPGIQRHIEQENGESNEPIVNGSDNNSEYNVDVEMEDVSWKENSLQKQNTEPQPSSSETHLSVNSVEERIQVNPETPMDTQEKETTHQNNSSENQNETVKSDTKETENKCSEVLPGTTIQLSEQPGEVLKDKIIESKPEMKEDVDMKTDLVPNVLVIPEIKVDDAEMTEQKLNIQSHETSENSKEMISHEKISEDSVSTIDNPQTLNEDSCSSSTSKEDVAETKIISEVLTSSEESSSSSDNTDGNSNSPKTDLDSQTEIPVETVTQEKQKDDVVNDSENQEKCIEANPSIEKVEKCTQPSIQTDNYSISDVNSELQQLPSQNLTETVEAEKDTSVNDRIEVKPDDNVEMQSDGDKDNSGNPAQ